MREPSAGAGVSPAYGDAWSGLLVGLAVAAVVAYCNATSSARLTARYPTSGAPTSTAASGSARSGIPGRLGFVVGKTASCAAMALTVGAYVWPSEAHAVAVGAVVALTAVNYAGLRKAVWLNRMIVVIILAVLATVVTACLTSGTADLGHLDIGGDVTAGGVLQAAGLLFFAFAGYAHITTQGEEVRDPRRVIPRAIPLALVIVLVVYAAVAVAVLSVLGGAGLAAVAAGPAEAVRAVGCRVWFPWYAPEHGGGSGITPSPDPGCLPHHAGHGARSAPATRPGRGPPTLPCATPGGSDRQRGGGGPRGHGGPARGDRILLRSGCWSTRPSPMPPPGRSARTRGARPRAVPVAGLAGCVVLAFTLPAYSVVVGAGVLTAGAAWYGLRPVISRR